MKCQQQLVECRYGEGGYACCEDGPCAAEVHNRKIFGNNRVKIDIELLRELRDNCQASIAETGITPARKQYREDSFLRVSAAIVNDVVNNVETTYRQTSNETTK